MTVTPDTVVVVVATGTDLGLVATGIVRHRWHAFFFLLLLVFYDAALGVCHLAGIRWSGGSTYVLIDAVSVLLQFLVVIELLRNVLPPNTRLASQGRRQFIKYALAGCGLAILAALFYSPPGMNGTLLLQMRLDLFTSLLVCETVVSIMMAAQHLGIGWRSHLIAVAQGLMVWALSLVVLQGVTSYVHLRAVTSSRIYYAQTALYCATVLYWAVSLWRDEPARKPISPEMRKYVVALHDQVHYDLRKVGH